MKTIKTLILCVDSDNPAYKELKEERFEFYAYLRY